MTNQEARYGELSPTANPEKFKELFPKATSKELEKAGYTKGVSLEETRGLQEHLRKLEEGEELFFDLKPEKGKGVREETAEERENRKKLAKVAKDLVDCLNWRPEKEEFFIVTDSKVMRHQLTIVEALRDELERRVGEIGPRAKGNYKIMVAPESKKSAHPLGEVIGERMIGKKVLILTARSRTHSRETTAARSGEKADLDVIQNILASSGLGELIEKGYSGLAQMRKKMIENEGRIPPKEWLALKDLARKRGSSVISVTKGDNPFEILTRGAVEENVEVLRERARKIDTLMRDVEKVHITSPLGTDLWLEIRLDKSEIEDGVVDQPGKITNYPIGEWSCSLKWTKDSRGILVSDGPFGGGHNLDQIDQPITTKWENGRAVSIEGGQAAEKLREYLNSSNDPRAYQAAELGIGTNGRACEDKPPEWIGSSEAEKMLGTIHIAFGNNQAFGVEEDDPYSNDTEIHCDVVVGVTEKNPVTLECIKKDGTKFILIEKGEPKGY